MTHNITHPKSTHTYRPDIDGLRGVAVALVLGFHAFPALIPGGFVGVDIFFVISGYLISSILIKDLTEKKFSFSDFWGRRIRRIFPALVIVLIASLGFGYFALFAFEFKQLGLNSAAGAGFISNFVSITQAGYFDTAADTKPLLHLWSLAIEEQFYIVWPILLWFTFKLRIKPMIVIVLVCALSFLLNIRLINTSGVVAFYSPQTRVWELLAGALVASLTIDRRWTINQINVTLANLFSLLGFALIITSIFILNGRSRFPGLLALLPVVGTCMLIIANQHSWIGRTILSSKLLVGIGLISYPLYLWHWPILSFLQITTGHSVSTSALLIALATSVLLAWITYRFVELPIRFSGHKRLKTYLLVCAMIACGLVGYFVYQESGFPNRQSFKSYGIETSTGFGTDSACQKNHPQPSDFCTSSKRGETEDVLLLGDSHAQHLFLGLKKYFDSKQQNLVAIGIGNCQPLLNVETKLYGALKHCPDLFNSVLSEAASTANIKTVILSSYAISAIAGGIDYISGKDITLINLSNQTLESQDAYLEGLSLTLKLLTNSNKDVVLILDNPELNFDPTLCIGRPLGLAEKICRVPRNVVDNRLNNLRKAILELTKRYPTVRIFDPFEYLCDRDYCYAELNGQLLYHDKNHLSKAGSNFLGEAFLKFNSF